MHVPQFYRCMIREDSCVMTMADESNCTLCAWFESSEGITNTLKIRYKNHRGEIAMRRILPLPIPPRKMDDDSPIHPGKWVIEVWDLDKDAQRSYCLEDICNLKEEGNG
jgi:hypothetical protein